ncbi:hypothetical protein [Nostoc sp. DSM 114167]
MIAGATIAKRLVEKRSNHKLDPVAMRSPLSIRCSSSNILRSPSHIESF